MRGKSFATSEDRWAIILAGGEGARLRPLTRLIAGDQRPKQFCAILGGETLLDQTRRRAALAVPPEKTMVVVTSSHERFYKRLLANVPSHGLVVQPENRGTAPAILYSLLRLAAVAPSASAAFFPSDHHFSDDERFISHVESAFEAVQKCPSFVVLLGMSAESPEVEYGWIEPSEPILEGRPGLRRIRRFWEKPSPALARALLQGGCLWNSFIMVGRLHAFLEVICRATPGLYEAFTQVGRDLNTTREERQIRLLYSRLLSTNFSEQVLARRPWDMAVLPVRGVGWSDWGRPSRVLSDLQKMGKDTALRSRAGDLLHVAQRRRENFSGSERRAVGGGVRAKTS